MFIILSEKERKKLAKEKKRNEIEKGGRIKAKCRTLLNVFRFTQWFVDDLDT